MPEFLKVKTSDEVIAILQQFEPLDVETVGLDGAHGRILASPVSAPEPVPHFDRATMDGFAVRARDTFGATESLPALLEMSGEIRMGKESSVQVGPGRAVSIATGGMLPEGADAVVMVEYTSVLDAATIEVTRPVAPGDNVLKSGEDIASAELLFPTGWRIRSQDIGALAALGIRSVCVHRRPRVAIISTGDEIVPVETSVVPPGKIRDINSYTLAAQVYEAGGLIVRSATVSDDLDRLVRECREALADHDMVLISGGSSVGSRDFTVQVIENLPGSELLVHGVAVRPGKPTILARVGPKVLWGLPGQPVSAMMIFGAFVRPSLARLQGGDIAKTLEERTCKAVLTRQLPSVHGRMDYAPVVLSGSAGSLEAMPLFGKSAMVSMLVRSDGFVMVPEHVEGLDKGSEVTVHLFSSNVQK